ncbi:MAG TPA: cytochrome c maturation protein CcmE [Gemmatimonadaceae bacterium]|jgi:cytochrome c-type biogenesis protein CcmE|nr:cytochrome c maturation protein CcmE [Gemmatimonadaceae bacterium]
MTEETTAVKSKRRPVVIAAVVVALGVFGWLLYGGLDKNVVFFLTPGELLAKGTEGYDVPVRLGGQVKPGSVKWDDKSLRLTFDVTDGTSDIAVQSSGAPPQMFRDGQGVVVEGRFGRDHVFNSTGLMIKHSNEYRPPKAGEKPQEMYKTLIKGSGT